MPPEIQRFTQQLEENQFIKNEEFEDTKPNLSGSIRAELFLVVHNQRFPVVRWAVPVSSIIVVVIVIAVIIVIVVCSFFSPMQCFIDIN